MISASGDLVSVIMPAYNAGPTVRESMESVLAQDHQALELIVADDGSDDGTAEIAEGYAQRDSRVKVLRLKRMGVVNARNAATREAKGRYVAFCDSDDLWHEAKLSCQLSFMRSRESAISATAFQRIDETGVAISGTVAVPDKLRYADILRINPVCCASVMYDRSVLGDVLMFDYREASRLPLYMRLGGPKPLHEDYIAWTRILKAGHVIDGLSRVLTYYRVRQSSHSANKVAAAIARWYINRTVLGLRPGRNAMCFIHYAVASSYRRLRWRLGRADGPIG